MGDIAPKKGKENRIPSRPRARHHAPSVRRPKVSVTFINCDNKSWRSTGHQSQVALSHAALVSHSRRKTHGFGQTNPLPTKHNSTWVPDSTSKTADEGDNDDEVALASADKKWKVWTPQSVRQRHERRTHNKGEHKSADLFETAFVVACRVLGSSDPFDVAALPLSPRDSHLIQLAHSFGLFLGGSATPDKLVARDIADSWVSDFQLSLSNKSLLHALIALGASICAGGSSEKNDFYLAYAAKHKLVAISSLRDISTERLRSYRTLILIRLLVACEFYNEDIAAADVHQKALHHLFGDMTKASGISHLSTGASDIWTAGIRGHRTRAREGDHDPGPWRQCFSAAAFRLVREYASASDSILLDSDSIDSSLRFNVKILAIVQRIRDITLINDAAKQSRWNAENRDVEHEIKQWLHFYRVETSKLLNNVAVDHAEVLSTTNLASGFAGYHALSCAMALALRCQWLLISQISSVAPIQLRYWDMNANATQERLLKAIQICEKGSIKQEQENVWFYVLFVHAIFSQYLMQINTFVAVKEKGSPAAATYGDARGEALERLKRQKLRRGLRGVSETKEILAGFWPHKCYTDARFSEVWQVLS
ncbi:uncharacterized protein Z520_05141 [Fonsecaea multimorphosa CBS 102226]|uniref:Transcription factor domain-containing protein n=1 Tax=Fonsecaea multimorphosa CBS 102226 TaxID=1442371 RepID=A0A0D2HCD9_9EURO|nr:uncharacterized protein Z520_05141 [Fonsecaea multimorphosa CBS 102226]KIX99565.1 hypothetical protein Z520_05141 [Fonsecaea multimorphosa CBS 102226]OAL25556.1 hypothetical protein AYO22_04875 [Fonsecaea multimorphosa]